MKSRTYEVLIKRIKYENIGEGEENILVKSLES
jgi:hypothetical protein